MPIVQKPASGGGTTIGIISLPPTTSLIDPTELSNDTLISLGFDPLNLPDPLTYPKGMAVSLIDDSSGNLVLTPTDLSSNESNFIGFLALATLSDSTTVSVTTIRGSETTIFGVTTDTFTQGDQLFLSETVGRVTTSPPTTGNKNIIRVGFCISSTKFIINTDVRIYQV